MSNKKRINATHVIEVKLFYYRIELFLIVNYYLIIAMWPGLYLKYRFCIRWHCACIAYSSDLHFYVNRDKGFPCKMPPCDRLPNAGGLWSRAKHGNLHRMSELCLLSKHHPVAKHHCPACRTTLVATRFRVAVICPIIQVPHCISVFFYFVWFVFINHIFQFYYELCTYCDILDIYLS